MTSTSIYSPLTHVAVTGKQIGPGIPAPGDSPEQRKLKKAAGDFESILLSSMWKGMKQSFGPEDTQDSDPAKGTLDDWGIEVMSSAVGKAGGLGIAKLILQHLQPTLTPEIAPIAPESAQGLANSADVLRDR